jgi:hypothetical protein
MSRSQLQAVPAQRRLAAIEDYISRHIYQAVYGTAASGKSSYLYPLPKTTEKQRQINTPSPLEYVVTPNDMMEGLQTTFPDCKIAYSEEWVDVRPGVRELRTGILIDWS